MAELTIQWETLSSIPQVAKKAPAVTTGEEAAPTPASDESTTASAITSTDKPYLIYVADTAAADVKFDAVEKVILEDDRVRLGCKAFHAVRMSPDDAKADPLLAEKGGKELPRFIFVTADQKTVKALEGGSLKLGEVWCDDEGDREQALQAGPRRRHQGAQGRPERVRQARQGALGPRRQGEAPDRQGALRGRQEGHRGEARRLDARQKKAEAQRDKLWDLKPKVAEPKALAKA